MCPAKHTKTASQHKVELRAWEKKLRQETSEKSVDKLVQTAKDQINLYIKNLPQHGMRKLLVLELEFF